MFSKQITRKRLEPRILLLVGERLKRVESSAIKGARLRWRRGMGNLRYQRYQGLNVRDCGPKTSPLKDEIWKKKVTAVDILFLPIFLIIMFPYSLS